MTAAQTTSVLTPPSAPVASTVELVAFKEQAFSPADVGAPGGVAMALHRVQRAAIDATASARTLPVLGGTYWPNVAFVGGESAVLAHGCGAGVTVSFILARVRVTASSTLAPSVVEVAQDASTGRITLAADVDCICDLWFYPQPLGKGSTGAGSTVPPITPPIPPPTPPSVPITWAADLANSADAAQYVSTISYDAAGWAHGAGGTVQVRGTSTVLDWVDGNLQLQQAGVPVLRCADGTEDFYNIYLGDWTSGQTSHTIIAADSGILFYTNNGGFSWYNIFSNPSESGMDLEVQPYIGGVHSVTFQEDASFITIGQYPRDEDAPAGTIIIDGQSAWQQTSAPQSNTAGGRLSFRSGSGQPGIGVGGAVTLSIGQATEPTGNGIYTMIAATESVFGQRAITLGYFDTDGNYVAAPAGSGDNVVFVNTVKTTPTTGPSAASGTIFYSDGYALWVQQANVGDTDGIQFQVEPSPGAGTGLSLTGSGTASTALEIATTGVTAGSYGDSSHYPTFSVNAQGQLTVAGTESLPSAVTLTAGTDISVGTGPSYEVSFTGTLPTVSGTAPILVTGGPSYAVALSTSGVTAGTYVSPTLTVDAYGRITSIGAQSDMYLAYVGVVARSDTDTALTNWGTYSASPSGPSKGQYGIPVDPGWISVEGGGGLSVSGEGEFLLLSMSAGSGNLVQAGDLLHITCQAPPPQSIDSAFDVYTELWISTTSAYSWPSTYAAIPGAATNNGCPMIDAWYVVPSSPTFISICPAVVNRDLSSGSYSSVWCGSQTFRVEIWRS